MIKKETNAQSTIEVHQEQKGLREQIQHDPRQERT